MTFAPRTALRQMSPGQRLLLVLGVAMLVVWGAAWAVSLGRQPMRLVGQKYLRFHVFDFVGLDFLNAYHAANHWHRGGNPYTEPFNDPLNRPIIYPPAVLPLFAWCQWVTPRTGTARRTVANAMTPPATCSHNEGPSRDSRSGGTRSSV